MTNVSNEANLDKSKYLKSICNKELLIITSLKKYMKFTQKRPSTVKGALNAVRLQVITKINSVHI